MTSDKTYMQRALDLAANGLGKVSPNPMVGCVIVHNDQVVSEAYHAEFGGPHAEVLAIDGLSDLSVLSESTVYVNLEPCSHYGKTPPCADLLVEHSVQRVVIGIADPNPKVIGSGIKKLQDAGVATDLGVLKEEARWLNRRFLVNQSARRPYVILKWAETEDGFMAKLDGSSKWISGKESRTLVHKWRHEEDGILVGRGTVEADNPQLNVRLWEGRDPVRVIIDPNLTLSPDRKIFSGKQHTVVYNRQKEGRKGDATLVKIDTGKFLDESMADLLTRNVGSVLVEGGARTLSSFLEAGCWDEARVFRSRSRFGDGIAGPNIDLEPTMKSTSGDDELLYFYNPETLASLEHRD